MTFFLDYTEALARKKTMEEMGQVCTLMQVFPSGYNLICNPTKTIIAPQKKPLFTEPTAGLESYYPQKESKPDFIEPVRKPLIPTSPIDNMPPPKKLMPWDINYYLGGLKPQPMTGNYEYQQDAVNFATSHPASLVEIPTGRGKTNVGIGLISYFKAPSLIVVPTIDLVSQWQNAIEEAGGHVTIVGGGKEEFSPLTIITYQSAIRHLEDLRKYSIVIFDEVHHLFAPEFLKIAKAIFETSNHVMGLTASVRREGTPEASIQDRLFPAKFARSIAYFQSKETHKVELQLKSYGVTLSTEEMTLYSKYQTILRNMAKKYGNAWMSLARNSQNLSPDVAREIFGGLSVFNKRNKLLNELPEKIDLVSKIVKQDQVGKFIIFCDTIAMVNLITETLQRSGVMAVKLHSQMKANRGARGDVLESIRNGTARVLVGAKAIEEGIDIPNLDNAIFLGNTKKDQRGYIQRAGRILRPVANKKAVIYVLYGKDTIEETNMQTLYDLYGV